jgi:cysteinyl-tRNA synthetase
VVRALQDDLNTPAALAALHRLAKQVHATADLQRKAELAAALRQAGAFMGLLGQDAMEWTQAGANDAARIDKLVLARANARSDRDWARADAIRQELAELGVEIEDSGDQTRWRVRT